MTMIWPELQDETPRDILAASRRRVTPLGEYLDASFQEGLDKTVLSLAGRETAINVAESGTDGMFPVIGEEDYRQPEQEPESKPMSRFEWESSNWYRDDIPWSDHMTPIRAQAYAEAYDARRYRESLIERSPAGFRSVLGFGAGILGSIVDPINFIPIFGEATMGRLAGLGIGRIGARTLAASGEAAIGTAATEPILMGALQAQGEDYGWEDAALDVVFGAAAGGVFGAGHGLVERIGALRRRLPVPDREQVVRIMEKALADVAAGEPVDVSALMDSGLRAKVRDAIVSREDFTADQAEQYVRLMDAAARSWAETYGRTPDEWWSEHVAGVEPMSKQKDVGLGQNVISPAWISEQYELREVPDGWYVHGRRGRQDLNTGTAIQLTQNWDVADQYAGKKGSRWIVRPKPDAKVFDATDKGQVDGMLLALARDYEDGMLTPDLDEIIRSNGDDVEALRPDFSPEDIVDSAMAYDNEDIVQWLYDRHGVDFVKTGDGAVAINLEAVESIKVEPIDSSEGDVQFAQRTKSSRKGAVSFLEDSRAIIHLFETADVSTLIHELGHILRRTLRNDDAAIIERWAGVQDGNWTREAEEMFAQGFEHYLSEGRAPSRELEGVFQKIKQWMLDIYQSVRNSGVEITDDVRGVFDRLLSTEQERRNMVTERMDRFHPDVREISTGESAELKALEITPEEETVIAAMGERLTPEELAMWESAGDAVARVEKYEQGLFASIECITR